MRRLSLLCAALAAALTGPAQAEPEARTLHYTVVRDGEPIGTSTVRIRKSGPETVAEVATRIAVKIAFVTVYRYEQHETERWADGRLVALNAVTDDNGTPHKVSATRSGGKLRLEADGKVSEVDPALMPFSPWNAELVRKTAALSTNDGRVTPLSVTDLGEEELVLQGRPLTARHYSLKASFPQEVWYDRERRLVQVEIHGSDGSKIRYQPG